MKLDELHNSLPANITDEVRVLRDRGIAEYIWSMTDAPEELRKIVAGLTS